MAGIFSMGAFVTYGNNAINNLNGKSSNLQDAFRADLKKNIAIAGYPTKDEIGIIDTFNLPAPDGSCTDATIEIVHKPTKTSTGVSKMGGVDKPWESTIKEHDEYSLTNRRDPFKVK